MKRTFAAGLHVDEAPRSAHRPTRIDEIEPVEVDMEAPARGASSPAKDDQALGWDDEELETSIFDKPVGADTPEARANGGFSWPR